MKRGSRKGAKAKGAKGKIGEKDFISRYRSNFPFRRLSFATWPLSVSLFRIHFNESVYHPRNAISDVFLAEIDQQSQSLVGKTNVS